MRPSRISAIRSPRRRASDRSWVMKTMVRPSSWWSRATSSCISRRMSGSRALNGSSNRSTSGSAARARARPTRCCWPPESWPGRRCSSPSRPTLATSSAALSRRSPRPTPWISSPYATLSRTVRCGSRPKCWKTMAARWRRRARSRVASMARTSSPSIARLPAVGSISRVRQRTRVDLPDPERPITTKTSPLRTSKVTSRTAAVQPVRSRSSAADRSASAEPGTFAAALSGPKTFQRPSTEKTDGAAESAGAGAAAGVAFIGYHRPGSGVRLPFRRP